MPTNNKTETDKKHRVAKNEWIAAALEALEHGGVAAVRVEKLAENLSVSKSGFYWHFRDRTDLLEQLLEYWFEAYTGVISSNPEIAALAPRERLEHAMRMIDEHSLAKYDLAIRAWAAHDPMAEDVVKRVTDLRMRFIRKAFADLGFTGEELEMRTRLFVVYHSCEHAIFSDMTPQKRAKLRRKRLKFFVRK